MALEKQIKRGKIKVSSGDRDGVHPYLIPELYILTIDERLKRPNTFYSKDYRDYLEGQKEECQWEIYKKTKEDLL